MKRYFSTLFLLLLVTLLWQPYLKDSAEESKTSIKGSFFCLFYDEDLTSPKQALQVRQWLEETWQFFLKQGYRNPQHEDGLIKIFMQGSFLLTNYARLDTKPYRIYLAVELGKNPERKKREKTLIAHEIFHTFQSVYCWPESRIRQESAWLFEGTALLASAKAADNIDLLQAYPYQSDLDFFNNTYGAVWFWKYLTDKYQTLALKEIWEILLKDKSANSREIRGSIDITIRQHTGKSLCILVKEFLDYYSYSLTSRSPKP
jgi:hypothetical protein